LQSQGRFRAVNRRQAENVSEAPIRFDDQVVAANLDAASDLADFGTPGSINDELQFVADHMP
jgi:hypothetical protein